MVTSPKCRVKICIPTGRPSLVRPHGTLMHGMPARLPVIVKMSDKYMARGSSTFSPRRNAGKGETGATTAKDFGKVMKAAVAKLAGKNADGKRVSEKVRAKLGA